MSKTLADGELFLGIQHTLNAHFDGQLGLAVATTGSAQLSGNIWDEANPIFNNFAYNYNINHTHVAVKGKLLADMTFVMPYVSASLGVGFNNASHFSMTPLIFEAIPTPDFASKTMTSFTYTLGIGLQRALTNHWQVGVGYEFADWGRSQLGAAPGQTLGGGLSLSHLYTNGVMFNLTFVA